MQLSRGSLFSIITFRWYGEVKVSLSDTGKELKSAISSLSKIPVDAMKLLCSGKYVLILSALIILDFAGIISPKFSFFFLLLILLFIITMRLLEGF